MLRAGYGGGQKCGAEFVTEKATWQLCRVLSCFKEGHTAKEQEGIRTL